MGKKFPELCDVIYAYKGIARKVAVKPDTSLLDALISAGIVLDAACGGQGKCGQCRVLARGALTEPSDEEVDKLGPEILGLGWRLACQAFVKGNVEVIVDDFKTDSRSKLIDSAFFEKNFILHHPSVMEEKVNLRWDDLTAGSVSEALAKALGKEELKIRPEALQEMSIYWEEGEGWRGSMVKIDEEYVAIFSGHEEKPLCAFVCDVGTTAISIVLLDLKIGKILSHRTIANPQRTFGADIISRISKAINPKDLLKMQTMLIDSIAMSMRQCLEETNISKERVFEILILGNTVMEHLFWGISPKPLARTPYVPVFKNILSSEGFRFSALPMHPSGRIWSMPIVDKFVGGDMISVLFELLSLGPKIPCLVIDLGTNGEIGLILDDKIFITSAAAGPAFEGGAISCGMVATDGAIYSLEKDGEHGIKALTIGEGIAKGLCGSGVISAVALFKKMGLIDDTGRIKDPDEIGEKAIASLIVKEEGRRKIMIADDITLTQSDIRQVQLAKGAISTAIDLILEKACLGGESLSAVYLAGSFGSYLNPEDVTDIGLLPKDLTGEIKCLGNAALSGGVRFVLGGRESFKALDHILSNIEFIDIEKENFNEKFLSKLAYL